MSPLASARNRLIAAAGAAVAVTGVVVAASVAVAGDGAASTSPRKAVTTAKVTWQDLVVNKTVNGSLGYATGRPVSARAGGTVTALPAEGATVIRGQALSQVDGKSVVLLYGTRPAYRPLAAGTTGEDVRQLEANLRALGYRGFTVDTRYTTSTATAVRAWQKKRGVPRTGSVEPSEIVFAPGPVRVGAHKASVGDQVGQGTPLYDGTGAARLVGIDLDVRDQTMLRRGLAVTVTLPDGRTTPGRVATVGKVAKVTTSSNTAKTTVAVTVGLDKPADAAAWDQAPVEISFATQRRPDVLAVPVTALLALSEGGYGVEVVDGSRRWILAVQAGMFARGLVEVSGEGLSEGQSVAVPAE